MVSPPAVALKENEEVVSVAWIADQGDDAEEDNPD